MRCFISRLFGFIFAASFFAAPVFANDVQATLDRLANMDFTEQQTWLRDLEKRADNAARIALPEDRAKHAQTEIADLLHRETITWAVLREAIEKTESLERRANEKLSKRADELIKKGVIQDREYEKLDGTATEATPPRNTPETRPVEPVPAETLKPREPKPVPSPILRPMPDLAKEPAPGRVEEMPEQPKVIDEPAPAELVRPERAADAEENIPTIRDTFEHPMETRIAPPSRSEAEVPAATPRELPPGAVKIDTAELGVRIAGCNMAFRALEADLDEPGPWNAKAIEPLLERLEVLSVRRDDLKLYRDLLPEGKRAKLAQLESPKTAVSRLGARIFEVRRALNSPDFDGSEAQRRTELARLEMLSRRLAKAAGAENAAERP